MYRNRTLSVAVVKLVHTLTHNNFLYMQEQHNVARNDNLIHIMRQTWITNDS